MARTVGIEFAATDAWQASFPGACAGLLQLEGVRNPESDERLDALLDATAGELRARFAGADRAALLATPPFGAYAAYYRRFDKTYHVLLQLESVALKGKPLRARGALVGAMFRGELSTGLLTAGHDLARVHDRIAVDVVGEGERYTGIGGREIEGARGDMAMREREGIVSSVVYGPDDRTRLTEATTAVAFATYAPSGVGREAILREFQAILEAVRVVCPEASVLDATVLEAT